MAEPMAVLSEWIERLKKLGGDKMPERVAQLAAPLVDSAIKKTINAGQTPLGQAWAPKRDGGEPLKNAAAAVKTVARARIVSIELTGPEVFHNSGRGGSPRRQIIPDAVSVPQSVWKALEKAARQIFEEIMSGK